MTDINEVRDLLQKTLEANRKITQINQVLTKSVVDIAQEQYDAIHPLIEQKEKELDAVARACESHTKAITEASKVNTEIMIEQAKQEERNEIKDWLAYNAPEFVWNRFNEGKDVRK